MPPGPTPKPNDKRERRNEPTFPQVNLGGDKAKAPRLRGRAKLDPATRAWWDDWVASPQAAQFGVTDWRRLLMLIPLVEAYYGGDLSRMTEIRLNEKEFGATPESRLRLRWKLGTMEQAADRAEKTTSKPPRRRADPRLKVLEGGAG